MVRHPCCSAPLCTCARRNPPVSVDVDHMKTSAADLSVPCRPHAGVLQCIARLRRTGKLVGEDSAFKQSASPKGLAGSNVVAHCAKLRDFVDKVDKESARLSCWRLPTKGLLASDVGGTTGGNEGHHKHARAAGVRSAVVVVGAAVCVV